MQRARGSSVFGLSLALAAKLSFACERESETLSGTLFDRLVKAEAGAVNVQRASLL